MDIILSSFYPIGLEDMEQVSLLNRVDTKYAFHVEKLNDIIQKLTQDYYMLEIDNTRIFTYETIYFDTQDLYLYWLHYQKRANRFKIRIRKYINTNTALMELKVKDNKGKTHKLRKVIPENSDYNEVLCQIIQENDLPIQANALTVQLKNTFQRITLVNKQDKERLTIDTKLNFMRDNQSICFDKLAIAEVKRDKSVQNSPFAKLMKELHILPQSISKYVLGVYYMVDTVKKHHFKMDMKELYRKLHVNY